MKKESVNKFDLEAAFKALEEIEVPVVKGIKPNRENLQEKFTKKSTTEVLVEDYFDVNDQGDLEAAQEEREAEIAKAKLARIEKIVDLDAESEEDLLPSYVGKFIIQCPQCMTLFYKNQEDIEKSEENPEVVNINEVCQHCGNTSGYTLIGKVDNVGEEEAENYDVEDFDENELNLDFDAEEEPVEEESTEEEPVEDETAEEGNEEELELEPVEETEEETSGEEEVKESLSLNEARTKDWVVIQHYYPTLCRKDQVTEVTHALNQALELFEDETLGGIDEIEPEAKRISKIKDFSMLLMAEPDTPNIPYGQPMTAEQYAKCVLDSDLSRTLYVVGVNVYGKPFREELKKAGYNSAKALRLKESYGDVIEVDVDELRKEHSDILKDLLRKAKSNTKASIKLGDIDIDMDPWDELDFIGYITVDFHTKDGVAATNELISNLANAIEADGDLDYYINSAETDFEPTNNTTCADDLIKHACEVYELSYPTSDEEFADFLHEVESYANYLSVAVVEKGYFDHSHHENDELYESKTTKQRLTVVEPGYQYKDKDGSIYTLYGEELEEDDTGITYDWEFVDDENGDIYIKLVESLTEELIEITKKPGDGTIAKLRKEHPEAIVLDTTDPRFEDRLKDIAKGSVVIIDEVERLPADKDIKDITTRLTKELGCKVFGVTTRGLNEAVDKELDDKLKAHNEYIEYLKEMIEKEEKSLANAKNDFVKKSIQSRIDALKADLEAALPEALKGEVETELPTAEEVELEATENTEEKEETKESLNKSLNEGLLDIVSDNLSNWQVKNFSRKSNKIAKKLYKAQQANDTKAIEKAKEEAYDLMSTTEKCFRVPGIELSPITDSQLNKFCDDIIRQAREDGVLDESLNEDVKIIGDLSDYTPWSGAVDTWNKIQDAGMIDDLDAYLEECYPEGLTATELNDILWFDSEWVLSSLGIIEEVEESLKEETTTLDTPKVKSPARNRTERLTKELASHSLFSGISDRIIQRYLIPLYLEDDQNAELSVEAIVDYFTNDVGLGKVIMDNIDDLTANQVKNLAKNDPVFIEALRKFLTENEFLSTDVVTTLNTLIKDLWFALGKDEEEAFDPSDMDYLDFKDELFNIYNKMSLDIREAIKNPLQEGSVEDRVSNLKRSLTTVERLVKELSQHEMFKSLSVRTIQRILIPYFIDNMGRENLSVEKVVSFFEDEGFGTYVWENYTDLELKQIKELLEADPCAVEALEEYLRKHNMSPEVGEYMGSRFEELFDLSLGTVYMQKGEFETLDEIEKIYSDILLARPIETKEALVGDVNINLDARGQSVGLLKGQGGEVHNDMTEGKENLDEFIGPAVASIAGASVANNLVNKAFSEEVEELKEAGDLDTLLDSEEFKKPISEAEVETILAKYESLEEDVEPGIESELAIQDIVDTWESVEEIDEESLDKLTENYLTEVYSNVKSFKTVDCALENNKLVVEGKITFNSGKTKNTKFIYEATKTADNKLVLEGLNADFATEKAFVLNCNLDTANRLVVESLNYKYTINNTLVEGLTK